MTARAAYRPLVVDDCLSLIATPPGRRSAAA
jgi:hypothetical protein